MKKGHRLTMASHSAREAEAAWEALRAGLECARHTPSPGASTAYEEGLRGSGSWVSGTRNIIEYLNE